MAFDHRGYMREWRGLRALNAQIGPGGRPIAEELGGEIAALGKARHMCQNLAERREGVGVKPVRFDEHDFAVPMAFELAHGSRSTIAATGPLP